MRERMTPRILDHQFYLIERRADVLNAFFTTFRTYVDLEYSDI